MIDPASVATGVASGYLTQKGIEKTNEVMHPNATTPQDEIIALLKSIDMGVNPQEKDTIDETMALQPYPSEYMIADDLHGRSHVCVFFFTATPIRFDGIFGGSYTANVGPGWKQIDIPGRLSTTDAQNHVVVVSYREDALGSSF